MHLQEGVCKKLSSHFTPYGPIGYHLKSTHFGETCQQRLQEGVFRMASTWYVGFYALMMALKSCYILVGGKKRKFDGESIKSQLFV